MTINTRNWATALSVSTVFAMGAIAMDPPSTDPATPPSPTVTPVAPVTPATPPSPTVTPITPQPTPAPTPVVVTPPDPAPAPVVNPPAPVVNPPAPAPAPAPAPQTKIQHDLQVIEEDAQQCWSCFSKAVVVVDNGLNQASVAMLLLTKNAAVYQGLLAAGLTANNIAQFSATFEKILGVANLSANVIAMIQAVINSAPAAQAMTVNFQPYEIKVIHRLTETHFKTYLTLLKEGMTPDNFTNKPYLRKVLFAAGLLNTEKNRAFLKTVLAKLSPPLNPAH